MERQLRDQAARLQTIQTQLLAEQTKAQASVSEMAQLRGELAGARREINRLSQSRDQAVADRPPVRSDAKSANLRRNDANDDVSRTGAIGQRINRAQRDRAVSTKPPENQPRNQQVATVRIAAQGTQKPVARAQPSKALTVISELDTATLRQLSKSAEAMVR
jgi:chromosome segregation ATPase